MAIRFPDPTQHMAAAGRTGSGKTWAMLEMLSARVEDGMAWVIIDHKRDENIKALPAEKLNANSLILPTRGLHVIYADMGNDGKEEIEGFLQRAFKRGKIGIYVDEGHLLGPSEAIRNILVAGRSKRVPLMWTSQRAHWIDPFIWSQSSFYRVFQLQTIHDIKRFNENFPMKWKPPEEFHSYYYDVSKGEVNYLKPSGTMDSTLSRLDAKLRPHLRAV
jgi:DNA helicase HerA-like ATPase